MHHIIILIVQAQETKTQGDKEAHPVALISCLLSTNTLHSLLPTPSHSNLYITNEHLVDLQPEPIHPFPTPSHLSAGGSHSTGIIRLDLVQERLEQPLLTLGW